MRSSDRGGNRYPNKRIKRHDDRKDGDVRGKPDMDRETWMRLNGYYPALLSGQGFANPNDMQWQNLRNQYLFGYTRRCGGVDQGAEGEVANGRED